MIRNGVLAMLTAVGMALSASAIQYTDWTSSSAGTASGSIGAIGVTYVGDVAFAQTAGGVNYWARSSPPPYNNPAYNAYTGVPNMPTTSDIVALSSTVTTPNTITFSSPVKDPIMLIMSQGQPSLAVYYDFAQDFVILSSGNGHWGGNPAGSLFEEPGDVLKGVEGHGAIQFLGTISSISWTVRPNEYWHGFTIGLPEAQGVPDGGMSAMLLGMGLLAAGMGRKLVK